MLQQDSVAVITGGGGGIGAAIASRLVLGGTRRVIISYLGSRENANNTVRELENLGGQAEAVQVDVSDDGQVRELSARCEEKFGRCDVLINCAGTTSWIPFTDLDAVTDEIWNHILGVNLLGAFRCARAFAPMLRASEGAIVNVASISAHRGIGSCIPYGVSKAALVQLTRSLAVTLGPEVRVNSVSPGTVATSWQTNRLGEEGFAEMTARERAVAPLARTLAPEDVADTVIGLLGARGVTGVDVIVDAGKHLMY